MMFAPAFLSVSFKTQPFAIPVYESFLEGDVISLSSFEDPESPALWVVTALFDSESRVWVETSVLVTLHAIAKEQGLSLIDLKIQDVPPTDWVRKTYQAFPPFEVGRFYIHGGHVDPNPSSSEKIPLLIEASTAFGSGEHATTKGCLLLLERLSTENNRQTKSEDHFSLLDMGTGTGILAFAMVHLFHVPVLAVDNDPEAVRVTQENAQQNHLSDKIIAVVSNGCENGLVQSRAPYNLITANILAQPLIHLAPDFAQLTEKGSFLILSGLLMTQAEEILKNYTSYGFEKIDAYEEEDWVALLLKRYC